MLKLVNVSKYYNNNNVTNLGLRNINLSFHKGEIVAITGESGSGKSTLLNVITKMDTFDEGEIYYKGNETSYFSIDDMDNFRKNKVGFIFQNYNIIDSYTVLENVMLPFRLNGNNSKDAKAKAIELIEKVGLKKRIHNRGVQLSGGEKQRCVIARALASNAEILACDEPTGNLDSQTSVEIINLIKEVAKDKLVLIVTHNYESIEHIATRKIKVHDGEIVEDTILRDTLNTDVDEELDLDYVKLDKKIAFNVALKNILKTPKKTILTSLVFFFIALFAISLYQSIMYLQNNEQYNNPFVYENEDKVLIYDINHNKLDTSKLDNLKANGTIYDYDINNFYAQTNYYHFLDFGADSIYECTYEACPYNLASSLSGGRMPSSNDECVLLLPENMMKIDKEEILSQTFSFDNMNYYKDEAPKSYKVVGYKFVHDIESGQYAVCGNSEIERNFIFNALFQSNSQNIPLYYMKDGTRYDQYGLYFEIRYDETATKPYLKYNPDAFSADSAFLDDFDYGKYHLVDGCSLDMIPYDDTEKANNYYTQYILYLAPSYIDKIDDNPYEAFIYSKFPKIALSKAESLGYSGTLVKGYSTTSALERLINNLWGYFAIVMASFTLIVIYFISYIILAKIYQSKRKDYTIIRTLGITKKDMRFIVLCEVLITTIVLSIIVYVLVFILGKTINKSVFIIFKHILPLTAVLYFIVMLLFGILIARRFNKKLFKFSVNKTLKAEEVKND